MAENTQLNSFWLYILTHSAEFWLKSMYYLQNQKSFVKMKTNHTVEKVRMYGAT